MASSEVEALRAQVRLMRSRATAKAGRLRRNKGVRLGLEPSLDPRRAVGVEKRYNATQLRAYVRQLQKFNDRSTQFVATADGRPVDARLAKRFEDTQRRFNETRKYIGRNFEGKKIPGSPFTFAEENKKLTAEGYSSRNPLTRANLSLKNMQGAGALETMIRTLETRMTPRGRAADVARARKTLDHMAAYIGDGGALRERLRAMGEDEILAFWSSPGAINSLALQIDSDKRQFDHIDEDPSDEKMHENSEVWERVEAISSILRE